MNRSRELWGDDAEVFRPERWLVRAVPECPGSGEEGSGDEDGTARKLLTKSAFEFPVFNGGPRSCLGKKMAELMACWVLVQVCREFDLEEVFEGDDGMGRGVGKAGKREERKSQNSLTLPMEGGLPCRIRLRGG